MKKEIRLPRLNIRTIAYVTHGKTSLTQALISFFNIKDEEESRKPA